MEDEAAEHEIIKIHSILLGSVEPLEQELVDGGAEVVAEGGEGLLQLGLVDGPGLVPVKRPETVLPVHHVAPQRTKLVETDLAGLVGIETTDHHVDGVDIECGVVSVGQRGLQLLRRDRPGLICVHPVEVGLELGWGGHVWRGRGRAAWFVS